MRHKRSNVRVSVRTDTAPAAGAGAAAGGGGGRSKILTSHNATTVQLYNLARIKKSMPTRTSLSNWTKRRALQLAVTPLSREREIELLYGVLCSLAASLEQMKADCHGIGPPPRDGILLLQIKLRAALSVAGDAEKPAGSDLLRE